MNEVMKNSFNKIKNVIYKKNESLRTLEDFVIFIRKENKTKEDLQFIQKLKNIVFTMIKSLNDLGTKSISLNSEFNTLQEGLIPKETNIEEHIKDIIIVIDQYIDGLSAMLRSFNFKNEYFQLRKSELYVKSYRTNLIKKFTEFRLKNMINEKDENYLYNLANDVIDVITKEGYKLRIRKLYEVLSRDYS